MAAPVEPLAGWMHTRWLEDCDFQLRGSAARQYCAWAALFAAIIAIPWSNSFTGVAAPVFISLSLYFHLTYFGGCRPVLRAHLSAFSLTLSWLDRLGGFVSFGIFGSLISLFI
jgi:hypothetical protein